MSVDGQNVAESYFQAIDDRINGKIADGLKKGTKLLLQKLNQHLSSKFQMMLDAEVDKRTKVMNDLLNTEMEEQFKQMETKLL